MKMNKKGFTIVELVIVIAVIAILAGVMIPTFGGVIDSANKSAAQQEAKGVRENVISADTLATSNNIGLVNADICVGVEKGGKTYYFNTVNGVTTDAGTTCPVSDATDATDKYTKIAAGTTVGTYTVPAKAVVYYKLKTAS